MHTARNLVLACLASLALPAFAQSMSSAELMQQAERYLRCEDVVKLGQSGQPEPAWEMLAYLIGERGADGKRVDKRPAEGVRMTPWKGLQAQVVVEAGYGFLVVYQHYPMESKAALLGQMRAAGWNLLAGPAFERPPGRKNTGYDHIPLGGELVTAYKAQKQSGKVIRHLIVTESKLDTYQGRAVDSSKLTVACSYLNADKPSQSN
jgi:hypothetical protein